MHYFCERVFFRFFGAVFFHPQFSSFLCLCSSRSGLRHGCGFGREQSRIGRGCGFAGSSRPAPFRRTLQTPHGGRYISLSLSLSFCFFCFFPHPYFSFCLSLFFHTHTHTCIQTLHSQKTTKSLSRHQYRLLPKYFFFSTCLVTTPKGRQGLRLQMPWKCEFSSSPSYIQSYFFNSEKKQIRISQIRKKSYFFSVSDYLFRCSFAIIDSGVNWLSKVN